MQSTTQSIPPLPSLRCPRIHQAMVIDGRLDEPAWKTTTAAELRLNDGGPATHRTQVKALWDEQNIYFGFDCEDPSPVGHMTRRDDALFNDANVAEVFLSPESDRHRFYEFEVNPLNTLLDLFFESESQPWSQAAKWNAQGIQTAVEIHKNAAAHPIGWSVEIAIPWNNFHTAAALPPQPGDAWRVNFFRYDTILQPSGSRLELCAWSRTLQHRFDVPERFGHLVFEAR